jgi:site-specific DNA-adenine methylase
LKQFFSYFGAKKRNAHKYPAPKYDTIIEPFAGSAGYSHLYHDREIVLYDAYPAVVNAWQYLIQASRDDILGLPLLKPGQSLSEFSLSAGERAFVGFWLVRAGTNPRDHLVPSWSKNYPNRFWGQYIRGQIASQVHLINHWKSELLDYSQIPNTEATWFIDPPYEVAGKSYVHSEIDYTALGAWCRTRQGQAIVCESEGASWLPFEKLYEHKGIQRAKRTEVIWLS